MRIPVTIPGCVSASGSTFSCGRILATDGFECSVYAVDEKCCIPTRRPYSFLASVCCCGNLLAIGSSCSNRIYVLNEELTEIDGFTPNTNDGPLQSVYPCPCNNGLILTYRDAVYLSDCNGNIKERLKRARDGVDFISVYPTACGCLTAYNDGYRDVIEYESCRGTERCTLSECMRIKSFTVCDGVVYGFFGKGYPYTFLAPVLENNRLNCSCIV